MKKLENLVCSIDWSKRLFELGVHQDTHFKWVKKDEGFELCFASHFGEIKYAAFTAQDFIDLFPKLFRIARSNDEWKFMSKEFSIHLKHENNLSNVFARILIRLLKEQEQLKL